MAQRKWIAKWSMGYVGTDNEEEIDLVEYLGYTEEEVEEMSDIDAESEVCDFAYEQAIQNIDSWAEKKITK